MILRKSQTNRDENVILRHLDGCTLSLWTKLLTSADRLFADWLSESLRSIRATETDGDKL